MTIQMCEFECDVNDYTGQDARLADGRLVVCDYVVEEVPGGDDWTGPSWVNMEEVALAQVEPEHMDHPHVIERHEDEQADGEIVSYVTLSILDRNAA